MLSMLLTLFLHFLASTSGPKRFDYTSPSKVWTCVKEGQTTRLHELLNEELSKAFQQDVRVLEDLE